jgi:hypothetical protein
LKRPRREWIVDRLIPVRGVTTLVGQPGEGKTTFAMGLALAVATGTKFAGQQIKQRPVILIAGEGQEDSRPLYEGWMKYQQALGKVAATATPEGAFHDGPLNLFEAGDTDKLIDNLKELPKDTAAPLIVLDALADMMDGGDEDRAKDMNKVYGNIWRVVRETGASFLIIHHAGWKEDREKGSIAIRAKSDVVTLVKLDAVGMTLNLTWLKNRRGPKYANVGFGVASVALDGWDDKVLAATGDEVAATSPQAAQAQTKGDQDLSLMTITLDLDLGGGATFTDWWHKMQAKYPEGAWSETTFRRKLNMLKEQDRVIAGGGKGEFYRLPQVVPVDGEGSPPPKSESQSPPNSHPHRGGGGGGGNNDRQSPPNNSRGGNASKSGNDQNQVELDALAAEEAKLSALKDGKKNGES